MLNWEEKVLLSKRMAAKATGIMYLARSGRDYCAQLGEAQRMRIELCTVDTVVSETIESTRIFENIFE